MQSGVVFSIESRNDIKLNPVRETVSLPDEVEEEHLKLGLDIVNTAKTADGREAQIGQAASEQLSENETIRINESGISKYVSEDVTAQYTEFVYLPGSFVAVDSRAGGFAIDLINKYTPVKARPSKIDLEEYLTNLMGEKDESLDTWKIGFYGGHGLADNGVVHGSNLLNDGSMLDILDNNRKNQLGIEYEYNSNLLKIFVTESGYVEVYQPSNFESGKFASFIDSEIKPYLVPE